MKDIFIFVFIILQFSIVSVYSQEEEVKSERLLNWTRYNQLHEIEIESIRFNYINVTKENSYLKFNKVPYEPRATLELVSDASSIKLKSIPLPAGIKIRKDSLPLISTDPFSGKVRNVVFSRVPQEELVLTGESVNVIYENINRENTFIKYTSVEEGYYLNLLNLNDATPVKFTMLCQIFIVASPSKTLVEVDENLKYDQIVWTPLENGQWEVRCGTVDGDGCPSEALDNLNKIKTSEYKKKRPKLIKK